MSKQKYYVVWNGRRNGVFDNWGECKTQVEGFSRARFKSFKSRQLAEEAFDKGYDPNETKVDHGTPDFDESHHPNWEDAPWDTEDRYNDL